MNPIGWLAAGVEYREHPRTWATGRPYHHGRPTSLIDVLEAMAKQCESAITSMAEAISRVNDLIVVAFSSERGES